MTIRTLAVASAVVAALYGLAALLVPVQFLAPFGVELPEAGLLTTRLFGANLLALAVINWFARNELRGGGQPGTERGIVVANVLAPTVSIILVVAAILGGVINAFGWVNVVILAVIVAAWLYFGLLERRTADTPT